MRRIAAFAFSVLTVLGIGAATGAATGVPAGSAVAAPVVGGSDGYSWG